MKFSKLSLFFGILSLVLCCGGLPLGLCGLIFGIIALVGKETEKTYLIGGLVTSGIGFITGLVFAIFAIFAVLVPSAAFITGLEQFTGGFGDEYGLLDEYGLSGDYEGETGEQEASGEGGQMKVLFGVGDTAEFTDLSVTLNDIRTVVSEDGTTTMAEADFTLKPITTGNEYYGAQIPVFYGYYDQGTADDTVVKINAQQLITTEVSATVKFTMQTGQMVKVAVIPQDFVSETIYFIYDPVTDNK